MATLKDVAKLACVDVSTVSRALSNTSYVHPETKKRILAAVKKLSYHPNILAKALREGKRHTIGIIIPRLHLTVFGAIAQGIEEAARKKGYSCIICHTEDDSEIEKASLTRLRNGLVDGIVVAGTGFNNHLIRDIHASGIAITQVIRRQDSSLSSVLVDYRKNGYEAAKYLRNKGCSNIGLINGPMTLAPYKERYDGYLAAAHEFNMPVITAASKLPVNTLEYGYKAAAELLKRNPQLDGIMAAVDAQGIGAMRLLKEKAIKVPEQIKVISLTGHIIGSMLETSLTAMELPSNEIGIKAALMNIEEIEAPDGQKPSAQTLVFPCQLIERESA
ncbi:MAG: LacI family transcriptional regulator [Acidaminococcaceae bacterium]|jgi:LacI family transcriptional regulator|nr:LacI family transcriptional regulator [Acidaminococcaceae bacterium]